MKHLILSCFSLTLCLVLFNKVNSFRIDRHAAAYLNEYDMSNNQKEKKVESIGRISPTDDIKIGQVGGLDTDSDGNLIVFHRASRKWSGNSFSGFNFNSKDYPAIKEDTIAVINPKKLKIVDSWGKDQFYMPHGLTVDYEGNIWLTDVGTHQVYKFDKDNQETPSLTLGVKLEPGTDEKHFCKPTSVAVAQLNGDIFVADGYCNTRVIQFDKNGKFVKQFEDAKHPLSVAHSIALLEDKGIVCTVSRGEGRIVCFDVDTGDKKYEITDPSMRTVYGIEYDIINQVLHAVTGLNYNLPPIGLTFDVSQKNFGKLLNKWQPKDSVLSDAHDVAISPTGSKIYAGQLNGEIDVFSYN